MLSNCTIDAVVTWVDGNDPKHRKKLSQHFQYLGITPAQVESSRLCSSGEINYCIKLLLKNAPWLRTIFVVTDAQQPTIIEQLIGTEDEGRVRLIDHKEIFRDFEHNLPTFNSLTIETVLWRIPDLAENFIYCNDDVLIMRPVLESDFFRDDKLVIRGKWSRQFAHKRLKFLHKSPDAHRLLQERSARVAGLQKDFLHLPHAPFALKKSLCANFFADYPDLLQANISYPLRDSHQFWPVSVMQHLALKNNHAILDNTRQSIMINGAHHTQHKQNSRIKKLLKNNNIAFLCIQGMEAMSQQRQQWFWEVMQVVG
jgi:hypothetical protein